LPSLRSRRLGASRRWTLLRTGSDPAVERSVGADRDDDDGTDRGALYLLTIPPDGSVAMDAKISAVSGSSTGGSPEEIASGMRSPSSAPAQPAMP